MVSVKRTKNYRKRTNFFIAGCILVLFYLWLLQYFYKPAQYPDSPNSGPVTAEFPEDIPVFTPSTVRTCHIVDPQTNAAAVFETSASVGSVSFFYDSALKEKGWKAGKGPVPSEKGGDPTSRFQVFKEHRMLSVRLTGVREGTEIHVRISHR